MRLETKTERQDGFLMWLGQGRGRAWLSRPLFSRASEMPGFKSSRAAPEGRWAGGSAGRGSEEDRDTQAGGWWSPRMPARGDTPRKETADQENAGKTPPLTSRIRMGTRQGQINPADVGVTLEESRGEPLDPKVEGRGVCPGTGRGGAMQEMHVGCGQRSPDPASQSLEIA